MASISSATANPSQSLIDSVPKKINLVDPYYHPRDSRLIWDPEVVQRKLEKEVALAKETLSQQKDYIHPAIPLISIEPEGTFYEISLVESSKQGSIQYETIATPNKREVAAAWTQNSRHSMEDEHMVEFGAIRLCNGQKVEYELFAVFDGHDGRETASYAKKSIHGYFAEQLKTMNPNGLTDPGIFNTLKATFVLLDQEIKKNVKEWSGSTAILSIKIGDQLWTANLGDSRAILKIGEKELLQLSVDAKPTKLEKKPEKEWKNPTQPEDVNRFNTSTLKRGGYILDSRVNGTAATSRAFNDSRFKSFHLSKNSPRAGYGSFRDHEYYVIESRPKITKHILPKNTPIQLLLACDGLWDVASSRDAASLLHLKGDDGTSCPLEQVAFHLVRGALKTKNPNLTYKCRDNVTVLVADLTM